jgi:hypothetical protein
MTLDALRRLVYALLLLGMAADLWVVTWADQLDARARSGWLPPLHPYFQPADSNDSVKPHDQH